MVSGGIIPTLLDLYSWGRMLPWPPRHPLSPSQTCSLTALGMVVPLVNSYQGGRRAACSGVNCLFALPPSGKP